MVWTWSNWSWSSWARTVKAAVRPCVVALALTAALPSSVWGPVLCWALSWFAVIWAVMPFSNVLSKRKGQARRPAPVGESLSTFLLPQGMLEAGEEWLWITLCRWLLGSG